MKRTYSVELVKSSNSKILKPNVDLWSSTPSFNFNVCIKTRDSDIYTSPFILCQLDYYKALFNSIFKETISKEISIDASSDIVKQFLSIIYSYQLSDIKYEDYITIYSLANYYVFNDLKDMISESIYNFKFSSQLYKDCKEHGIKLDPKYCASNYIDYIQCEYKTKASISKINEFVDTDFFSNGEITTEIFNLIKCRPLFNIIIMLLLYVPESKFYDLIDQYDFTMIIRDDYIRCLEYKQIPSDYLRHILLKALKNNKLII